MCQLDKLFKSEHNEDWKIEYAKTRFFTKDEEPFNLQTYLKVEEKAIKLLKNNIGKLYKYCSFDVNDYSLNNLLNSRVYLKNPNKFNDPFDSLYSIVVDKNTVLDDALNTLKLTNNEDTYRRIKEEIEKNKSKVLNTLDTMMSESVINECNSYRNKTWVTCFSEVYDSILMWSHYADNHTGFCIEYDFSKAFQNISILSPVLYIDKLYNISEHTFNGKGLMVSSLLKSSEWKYEKEWRLVVCNLQNSSAEFLDVPKPTAIYLGACSKGDRRITEFAEQNNIEVHKLRMSTEEYKLIV